MDQDAILTLNQLGRLIKKAIDDGMDGAYWVKAEMIKLNLYPRSGHCYPDLVDKQGNTIQAQMRANLWAADYQKINARFQKATGQPLHDGLHILFLARVSFHPVYGLAVQILDIDPAYTMGEMARQRQECIDKLRAEGVFDQNRQTALPVLPKRLAIISIETSKGYHDLMNVFQRSVYKAAVGYKLFPALLQGDRAVTSILEQLMKIRNGKKQFDAVLIIRGGGGDAGLNCYDDYRLAYEVATFPIPVISGIGHSTNETVVEQVSFANPITPTDCAYIILNAFSEFDHHLSELSRRLIQSTEEEVMSRSAELGDLASVLQNSIRFRIQHESNELNNFKRIIEKSIPSYFRHRSEKLFRIKEHIFNESRSIINHNSNSLSGVIVQLKYALNTGKKTRNSSLVLLEQKIKLMDPRNLFQRGYSITMHKGKAVRDASELKEGDQIETTLYHGNIKSRVEKSSD